MLQVKVNRGSSIAVPPFGGKLSIMYKSKRHRKNKTCRIGPGPRANLYYAYFEEDNVDFQIKMNNNLCKDRSLSYEMEILGEDHGFMVNPGKIEKLQTLSTYGRKFRFIRQSGKQGKSFVSHIATSRGTRRKEASLLVSRIKFQMAYSKITPYTIRVNVPGPTADNMLNLEVDRLTTVAQLKSKVSENIGHPPSNFNLSWKGRQQDDDLTLESLKVEENCLFDVISVIFPIKIEIDSMAFCTLQMSSWDSIGDLKKKIEQDGGIPDVQQKIVFREKELKSDLSVLGEFDITLNSRIQLTISNIFPLKVKLVPSNKIIAVPVCSRNTVQDVIDKLEKTHEISVDERQKIFVHGEQVFDRIQMLEDAAVRDSSSKMFLVDPEIYNVSEDKEKGEDPVTKRMRENGHQCQPGESFQISLKLLESAVICLTVCASETVGQFKKKIGEKLGRPVKKLTTTVKENEIKLSEKNFPLELYEIGENSEIREVDLILVYVKLLSGKTKKFECSKQVKIQEFKLLFQEKEGTPVDMQRFVFAGKHLQDKRTLEDYNIEKCTIQQVLRLRGGEGRGPRKMLHNSNKPTVSERGAITFGNRSRQVFNQVEFEEDELINIEPFTVELRLVGVPPLK